MCGIIGIFNNEEANKLILKGLEILQPRGSDSSGVTDGKDIFTSKTVQALDVPKSNSIIGHVLHAVVGEVAQPIKGKGLLVVNCEIYNWKELAEANDLEAENDAELLLKLLDNTDIDDDREIKKVLDSLDGVYAFCYWKDNKAIIARDLIGVKPVWFSHQAGFSFASEKKALLKMGLHDISELNPRTILHYDLKTNNLRRWQRNFFRKRPTSNRSEGELSKELASLIVKAIRKRIPSHNIKIGILFSGGVDSTLIAKVCKDNGLDATCYTTVIDNPIGQPAHDLLAAKKTARKYGFRHRILKVKEAEIPSIAKEVVETIEEAHAVKAAVGMPFLIAAKQARKDGCKILFSGLGAEELFAGYKRHKDSNDVNDECLAGLQWMYERDLYRDDTITMRNGLELRVPFLDKELTEFSLSIPPELKIKDGVEKYLLRRAAVGLGLSEDDAFRPKKAAQYGSKFDNALEKMARRGGKNRAEYLQQFTQAKNRKLGILCSGGKDSWYAAYVMKRLNYSLTCAMVMESDNDDSYMFHTPAISLVGLQAEAAGIPLIRQSTRGVKEEELKDLKELLRKAKEDFRIEGVVTGALYSQYQRERIEKLCDELDLKCYAPLWHLEQESELRELLREKFIITMSSIAGEGLSPEWLGKEIGNEEVEKLVELNRRIGFHVAGEGGEYESLVLDCPLFKKRLVLKDTKIQKESEIVARLVVKEAVLEDKW